MSRQNNLKSGSSLDPFNGDRVAFLTALVARGLGAPSDERLKALTSNEASGGDGGFLVHPNHLAEPERIARPPFELSTYARRVPLGKSNQVTAPVDPGPPHSTTGPQFFPVSEGQPIPQSKPTFAAVTGKADKHAALIPVNDDLLEDAPAMTTYVFDKLHAQAAYYGSLKMVQGNGVGEPLGYLNHPATVTIAIEAGQPANSIVAANVGKILNAFNVASIPTGKWLVTPDAQNALVGMTLNNQLIYSVGDQSAPAGRLLGIPILPHEAASALSTRGDISLIDPDAYWLFVKDPEVRILSSMHLWFDQRVSAFRAVFRMDGRPSWSAPVPSRVGNTLRSPFVTLASRP